MPRIAQHGDRVKPLALDVADVEQAERAVRAGVAAFGRLDVVVNNAGYGDTASLEDMTLDDFRRQIDTNFSWLRRSRRSGSRSPCSSPAA